MLLICKASGRIDSETKITDSKLLPAHILIIDDELAIFDTVTYALEMDAQITAMM